MVGNFEMKTLEEVIMDFSEANKEIGCGDCPFNDAESDDIPCEMPDCIFNDALHYLRELQELKNTNVRIPDGYNQAKLGDRNEDAR